MNDELERRLADNESIFREVNEAISRGGWPGDEERRSAFAVSAPGSAATRSCP